MDKIEDIIRRVVKEKRSGNIVVDDDSLLTELAKIEDTRNGRWWQIRHVGGFGFIVVCTSIIAMLVFLIHTALFYINDVIMFQNELRVNRYGTFVPRKSCNCEYAMFMFNTSDLWANTGIQLCRGDMMKISVSGAFHRSIVDVKDNAVRNHRLQYEWIGSEKRLRNEPDTALDVRKYCIYRAEDAYFGSVLYQIRPESQADAQECLEPLYYPVRQITPKAGARYVKVRESGILHLSVNDIYLTDEIIELIAESNKNRLGDSVIRISSGYDSAAASLIKGGAMAAANGRLKRDSLQRMLADKNIQLFRIVGDTAAYVSGDSITLHFRKNRAVWFDDNLGQIMVVVDIQRHMPWGLFNYHKWYRMLEGKIMDAFEKYDGWLTVFAGLISVFWVCFATALFLVLMGLHLSILIFIIYLLFIAVQLINDLSAWIKRWRPIRQVAGCLDSWLSSVFSTWDNKSRNR